MCRCGCEAREVDRSEALTIVLWCLHFRVLCGHYRKLFGVIFSLVLDVHSLCRDFGVLVTWFRDPSPVFKSVAPLLNHRKSHSCLQLSSSRAALLHRHFFDCCSTAFCIAQMHRHETARDSYSARSLFRECYFAILPPLDKRRSIRQAVRRISQHAL